MYFREKHTNTSQKPVVQLVESYRIGAKVKQRLIVSLGTEPDMPKSLWKTIAKSVEDKLYGIQVLWEDAKISMYSEAIVRKIQNEGKWIPLRNVNAENASPDNNGMKTAEVYIDNVDHGISRTLGPCLIGHTFWQRLGFDKILYKCKFSPIEIQTSEISILNRLISGDNEVTIPAWVHQTAIGDLIGLGVENFGKDRFYRISDKLLWHKNYIEKHLYQNEYSMFGSDTSLVLYDLTNSYFEGSCKLNPKAEYNGNQKEKRTDCPQIVVALVLDGDGFCSRHFTFKGTMSDRNSLKHILESLSKEFDTNSPPTVIMDRGVADDKNMELIKNYFKLNYIVASRSNEEKQFEEQFKNEDFFIIKEDKTNIVKVRVEKQEDITYLLCKSSGRERKEKAMRNMREQRLEESLQRLHERIKNAKINSPEQVNKAIGRIAEKHCKAAHYYDIKHVPYNFRYTIKEGVKIDKRLEKMLNLRREKALTFKITYLALEKEIKGIKEKYANDFKNITITINEPQLNWAPIDEKEQSKQALEGNYLLKTERKDLSDKQIWNIYMMLTRVEKAFRNLKSDLALRPNPHQKENRVDSHIFISILAYHLLHAIEFSLKQKGENVWWSSVKRVMSSHCYSTIILPTVKGTVIHLRKPGIPEAIHRKIYQLLDIDFQNMKKTKLYI